MNRKIKRKIKRFKRCATLKQGAAVETERSDGAEISEIRKKEPDAKTEFASGFLTSPFNGATFGWRVVSESVI